MNRAATIALVAAVRHRVELRRRLAHPQLLVAVLVGAGFTTLLVVGSLPGLEWLWPEPGAYRYGALVAEEPAAVRERARAVAAIAFVLFGALSVVGALASENWESPPAELLTAVSAPTAAFGVAGEELLERTWIAFPVSVGGAVAFAAGTGRPVALAGAALGALAVVATGMLVGTALGLGLRASIRGTDRLYRVRGAVGFVSLFGTFVALTAVRPAGDALGRTPLGWFGDLLLLTTPGAAASSARAAAALAAGSVAAAASLGLLVVAARILWFDDRVGGTDAGADAAVAADPPRTTDATPSTTDALLERVVPRPTVAVTRATWRRIRRSPRALLFVLFPFAVVGPVAAEAAVRWSALVPVLVTLYVAAAVGLGTTLNPIGNERVALPTICSTPGGRRAVPLGHAVAALVPGAPATLLAGLGTAVLVGVPPAGLLAVGIAALALAAGGVGLSLGVGAFLPKLEGPAPTTLSPPHLYATGAHLLGMGLLATPALAGFALFADDGSSAFALGGAALTALVAGLAGLAGFRYAVATLEGHEDAGE